MIFFSVGKVNHGKVYYSLPKKVKSNKTMYSQAKNPVYFYVIFPLLFLGVNYNISHFMLLYLRGFLKLQNAILTWTWSATSLQLGYQPLISILNIDFHGMFNSISKEHNIKVSCPFFQIKGLKTQFCSIFLICSK